MKGLLKEYPRSLEVEILCAKSAQIVPERCDDAEKLARA